MKTIDHSKKATHFNKDKKRVFWHDESIWFIRQKRDKAVNQVKEWEDLRSQASQIKEHTVSRLSHYLRLFEKNAKKNGIHIHWALNGKEHNQIVHRILKKHKVKNVVKSKSMLTEECHLNQYLESKKIKVVDTDLGERIIQLRKERPSHIVTPAIHLKKKEVGQLFHQHLKTKDHEDDEKVLVMAARKDMRKYFLNAEAGITGVNFAIAETGGIVVCTNEQNADIGASLPHVHIACMGIEKLIPQMKDLSIFLRILARSATGQPITAYSSHFLKPKKGGEFHIVIVDNHRSDIVGKSVYRKSLNCIRCGACINTCPVYRRSGGHSYGYVVPGPIGAVLAPHVNPKKYANLPFASSLCGSCTDVCPVKVDLHHQLLAWRADLNDKKMVSFSKRILMKILGKVLYKNSLYHFFSKVGRLLTSKLPRFMIYHRFNAWGKKRELPLFAKKSFKEIYQERLGGVFKKKSNEK